MKGNYPPRGGSSGPKIPSWVDAEACARAGSSPGAVTVKDVLAVYLIYSLQQLQEGSSIIIPISQMAKLRLKKGKCYTHESKAPALSLSALWGHVCHTEAPHYY